MCVGRETVSAYGNGSVWVCGEIECVQVCLDGKYTCVDSREMCGCVWRETACLYSEEMCGCVEGVCVHGGEMMYVCQILVCVCV